MWVASAPLYSQPTWQRTFGSVYTDRAAEMISTASGGYALVGTIGFTDSILGNSAHVVRTDDNGDLIWSKSYQIPFSTNLTTAFTICQTTDGGFLVGGSVAPFDTLSSSSSFLLRLDSLGDSLWSRVFNNQGLGIIYQLITTLDGNYLCRGTLYNGNGIVAKLNALGDTIWTIDNLIGSHVANTLDGNYILLDPEGPQFDTDPRIIKISSSGNVLWDKTYLFGVDFGITRKIITLIDGGYLAMGAFSGGTTVLKINSSGDSLWSNIITDSGSPLALDIAPTDDAGFIVTGVVTGGQLSRDIYLLKLDENGMKEWSASLIRTGYDEQPVNVVQTDDGGYVIFGWGENGSIGGDDLMLIKTDSLAGIVGVRENSDSDLQSIKFYPNPVNDWLEFDFEILTSGYVTLYDLSGKIIFSDKFMDVDKSKVFVGELKPGSYVFEISDLNQKVLANELLVKQ